jgi:hypothetical protein
MIWGSMLVSVLIYIFPIPRFIGENVVALLPPDIFQILRTALYIVSFGLILNTRFASKRRMQDIRFYRKADP